MYMSIYTCTTFTNIHVHAIKPVGTWKYECIAHYIAKVHSCSIYGSKGCVGFMACGAIKPKPGNYQIRLVIIWHLMRSQSKLVILKWHSVTSLADIMVLPLPLTFCTPGQATNTCTWCIICIYLPPYIVCWCVGRGWFYAVPRKVTGCVQSPIHA